MRGPLDDLLVELLDELPDELLDELLDELFDELLGESYEGALVIDGGASSDYSSREGESCP